MTGDASRGTTPQRRQGAEHRRCDGEEHERWQRAEDERERQLDRQAASRRLTGPPSCGASFTGQSLEHGSQRHSIAIRRGDGRSQLLAGETSAARQLGERVGQSPTAVELQLDGGEGLAHGGRRAPSELVDGLRR